MYSEPQGIPVAFVKNCRINSFPLVMNEEFSTAVKFLLAAVKFGAPFREVALMGSVRRTARSAPLRADFVVLIIRAFFWTSGPLCSAYPDMRTSSKAG
eukprot:1195505-Prorocentrum_minimum.AAC.12